MRHRLIPSRFRGSHRAGDHPRRGLTTAVGALSLALLPAGLASAQDAQDLEPRGIDLACSGDHQDPFSDLAGSAHERAVLCAAAVDIVEGHDDGTYRPRDLVQRDHMASFIVRWVELATGETLPEHRNGFDDVHPDNPHRDATLKLAETGIARGHDDGTFRPSQAVERDQMATFIARAISYIDDGDTDNLSAPPQLEEGYFSDIEPVEVHAPSIDALASHGIVVGYPDSDVYGVDDPVWRDQMATFIFRAYDYAIAADLFDE